MLKILLTLCTFLVYSNAYITIDSKYNTAGTTISNEGSFYNLIGSSECSSNCSNVWHYNATTTQNLKENKTNSFYNNKILSDNKYKVKKGLTEKEFIKKGITFFKNQGLENEKIKIMKKQ